MKEINLISGVWYERELKLTFPDSWDVNLVSFEERAPLSEEQIRDVFESPVETPRISELAKGRSKAVIIIDDLTRPTPGEQVMPFILKELKRGGIEEDNTLVMIGVGCHRQLNRQDMVKKLGEETLRKIRVKNNELEDIFTYVGESSRGTPIYINKYVMDCDLKIGVGGPYPHGAAAFSGGGKTILPGVSNFETIYSHHSKGKGGGRAGNPDCEFRLDLEEAAEKAGLDISVFTIINARKEVSELVVGDPVKGHRKAAELARRAYAVKPIDDADIVISNSYPHDVDLRFSRRGIWPIARAKEGATKVLIAGAAEGVGYHRYPIIIERRKYGGGKPREEEIAVKESQTPDYLFSPYVGPAEVREAFPGSILFNFWDELISKLEEDYRGKNPKVVVYDCASIQIPVG